MSITVGDIVGCAARKAELNDLVVMYALRQMDADYDDVHVIDSVDSPVHIPEIHVGRSTWVMFPRNFSGVHWGLVVASMRNGKIVSVLTYDPLQWLYDDRLGRYWDRVCYPYIQAWGERDGVNRNPSYPAIRRLAVARQHDGSSCGYCVAIAHDIVVNRTAFFTSPEWQLAPAIAQLRVRILWWIFCASLRDHERAEEEARLSISLLENTKPDSKTKSFDRNSMRKIAMTGSNWRS
jgi:hypothetical protein